MARAGLPATRAWSATSWTTTAPAATKAWRPMVTSHTTVALAPTVAPRRTSVGTSSSGAFLKPTRGVRSLVNTMLGPRNTSSSTVTRSQTSTAFLTVTRSPSRAPPSMKAWSPTLQSAPTTAPGSTWANAQMRVRGPTRSLSHSPIGWTNTDGSRPSTRFSTDMPEGYASVENAGHLSTMPGAAGGHRRGGSWRRQADGHDQKGAYPQQTDMERLVKAMVLPGRWHGLKTGESLRADRAVVAISEGPGADWGLWCVPRVWWWPGGSWGGTRRRASVDRLPAKLIFAGWD